MPTISRLFRDCPATIPGTAGEPRGDSRAVPERARRSSGREVWRQERRRAAGGAGSKGGRQYRESAERGRECGRIISRRRGEYLYLPQNCPLSACLCFRSIPIYPRCKRAVCVRFQGHFATVQKTARNIHQGGEVSGARLALLERRQARRLGLTVWSWRRSTEPETEKSPGRLRSLSGRVFTWSFSPRQLASNPLLADDVIQYFSPEYRSDLAYKSKNANRESRIEDLKNGQFKDVYDVLKAAGLDESSEGSVLTITESALLKALITLSEIRTKPETSTE